MLHGIHKKRPRRTKDDADEVQDVPVHRLLRDISKALISHAAVRKTEPAPLYTSGSLESLSSVSGLWVAGLGPLPLPVTRDVYRRLSVCLNSTLGNKVAEADAPFIQEAIWPAGKFGFDNPEWKGKLAQLEGPVKAGLQLPQVCFALTLDKHAIRFVPVDAAQACWRATCTPMCWVSLRTALTCSATAQAAAA